MKKNLGVFMIAAAGLALPAMADSNASGGGVANSESVVLGVGPFNHGGPVANGFNTLTNAVFTGGFLANRVRFSGTVNSVAAGTFGSEADIRVSLGGNIFDWQNPAPGAAYTTFNYNSSQPLTGALLNANPAGNWAVEFFDSFADDVAGVDSATSNVTMTFEQVAPVNDSNGVFAIGAIGPGSTTNRVGEFAVPQPAGALGNNDRYTFTLAAASTLTMFTAGVAGFTGLTNGDTEIGLFDSLGNIVPTAFDDDNGDGAYSRISNLTVPAGSYTLVVGDFATNFSGTSTLNNLTFGSAPAAGYDYGLTIIVPAPGALALLGLGGLAAARRRRA